MFKKVKAVLICVLTSVIGFFIGLWAGYNFVMKLIPTPVTNEGMLIFVYSVTCLIGLLGAVVGYFIGRMITGME